MIEHISAVLIVKNGEAYLNQCLLSLSDFKEIIVLENGSSDSTSEIAASFANVKLFHSPFIGFGPMKELASSYASNDWIFSIDCDEFISKELNEELKALKLNSNQVGEIHRLNYYNRKLINGCGWGNDFIVRIFNKRATGFNSKMVHESIQTSELEVVRLDGKMHHYSFNHSGELIQKMHIYAELYAQQYKFIKKTSVSHIFLKFLFAFFKFYILKKGFLYGTDGFIISWSNANGVFYKYFRLLENFNNIPTALIYDGAFDKKAENDLVPLLNSKLFRIEKLIVDAGKIDLETKTKISTVYPGLLQIKNNKFAISDLENDLVYKNTEVIIKTNKFSLINKNILESIHEKIKHGFYFELDKGSFKRIRLSDKTIFDRKMNFALIKNDL